MKIKAKVFLPSAISVLMLLIVGVVSVMGMRSLNSALHEVTDKGVHQVEVLRDARAALLQANLVTYRLFSTIVNLDEGRIKQETSVALGHADRAIASMNTLAEDALLPPEDKAALAQLAEPLAKYRKSIAQAIDMADSDLAAATGMMQAADKRFLQISEPLQKLIDAKKSQTKELIAKANGQANWLLVVTAVVFVAGVASAVLVSLLLAGRIVSPMLLAIGAAKSIAAGNLTNTINTEGKDETAELMGALDGMQTSLRNLIGRIGENAGRTEQSCGAMSSALKDITHSVNGQNEATSSVAAAVEEMTVSINNIHDNATQALKVSAESAELASKGVSVIQSASDEMLNISATVSKAAEVINLVGQQTTEISSIVNTIREVAEQTNLLALNAAIEAARAGEQGRGFAVVADEVRKLAEKTSSSSEEIRSMIEAVQNSADQAVGSIHHMVTQMGTTVEQATSARLAIEQIQASAAQSQGFARDISMALGEQSSASHLIARQIEHITQMSEVNANSVSHAGHAMQALEQESRQLGSAVACFKV